MRPTWGDVTFLISIMGITGFTGGWYWGRVYERWLIKREQQRHDAPAAGEEAHDAR